MKLSYEILPPSKIEVKTQRKAVADPTINICIPYFIILSSLILAKNIPNNNNIIKVIIIDEKKDRIKKILNNLHVNENAYISIFISHHSKDIFILDEIKKNSRSLFKEYQPSTLTKQELMFFDEQIDDIVEAVLPSTTSSPEKERAKKLQMQDKLEEIEEENNESNEIEDLEIRRALKTVEVMGQVIKNRAGSLKRIKLEEIFEEAMNVYLRFLSCLYEFIQDTDKQKFLIEFIQKRIEELYKGKEKEVDRSLLEKQSRKIYWNINFLIFYGIIYKIIHSLGSDKLTSIIEKIHDDVGSPASGLLLHGIYMSYNKNVQINKIAKLIKTKDFSDIAVKIMKFMISDYCSLHKINYRDRQRIQDKFKIPSDKLLMKRDK